MGTTSYTIHAETTWTDTITLDQNFTLINHTMPFIEANDEEQQFSSSEVEISMTSFSTRSYVSEDFSDEATLSEGTGLLWTNTSDYQEETNFNITDQFSSSNVEIDSNATVQLALSGDFLAEYSFTDDEVDGDPSGWTITEDASTSVNVTAELDNHAKVLEFSDNSAIGDCQAEDTFTTQATGTIEFWLQFDTALRHFWIYLYDGASNCINMYVHLSDTKLKYYDEGDQEICQLVIDTWYHIKVDWNADGFQVAVDGTQYGDGYAFGYYQAYDDGMDKIMFSTRYQDTAYKYYVDAVDYSWGSGYYAYRSYNNTYETSGYYESPQYNLGSADPNWYYQDLEFQRTVDDDTTLTLEYRHSQDNSTWESWSSGYTSNQTINANCSQYYQFRVNMTSAGNYTTTPSCDWVNLTYELQNSTAVDEYVGDGIIESWADYSNFVSDLFMNVSALCESNLRMTIQSDTANKTIEIWNDTQSMTLYTSGENYNIFNLSDYEITYIENITCSANSGEYWNSITIAQGEPFNEIDYINMTSGFITESDNSVSYFLQNASNNGDSSTTILAFTPYSGVGEAFQSFYANISLQTTDLVVGEEGEQTYERVLFAVSFRKGAQWLGAVYYIWNSSYIPWYHPYHYNSSSYYMLLMGDLEPSNTYQLLRNVSQDAETGLDIDVTQVTSVFYAFYCWIPEIKINHFSCIEYRSSIDISINGTTGDQTISTSGTETTLNFSTSVSDVEFTYTTTYNISYSGSRDWVWPTFVFTYEQLNQSCDFINMSFTELPPWYASYYPDFLTFYLLSKMSDPDVQSFLTDPVEGTITSTIFQSYVGNVTISEGGSWNFLLIIEMREDPPVGQTPQETPLAVQVLNKFGLFLGLLIGGVLGMMYIQGRRKAGNSGGTKVVYKTDKAGATTAKREASKWRKLYEQEHSDRVKLEKSKDKMQSHHEQEQKSILGKMQAAIEKEKKNKQHALSKTKDHFLSKISKLEAGKDAVSAKLSATSQELNSLKGNVSKAHHEIVNEVSNGMQSLFGTVENVGENVKDFAAQGVEHMKGEGQKIINNTHEKLKTVFKIKPKRGR